MGNFLAHAAPTQKTLKTKEKVPLSRAPPPNSKRIKTVSLRKKKEDATSSSEKKNKTLTFRKKKKRKHHLFFARKKRENDNFPQKNKKTQETKRKR